MSNSADSKAEPLSVFSIIGVLVVVGIVSVIIHVGMAFPFEYAFRGRTIRCSDVKEGMSFAEIRNYMRGRISPREELYTGDRLELWSGGEDVCTIHFDQNTNRVLKVERLSPPLTL
jgi:hypothetical protein